MRNFSQVYVIFFVFVSFSKKYGKEPLDAKNLFPLLWLAELRENIIAKLIDNRRHRKGHLQLLRWYILIGIYISDYITFDIKSEC